MKNIKITIWIIIIQINYKLKKIKIRNFTERCKGTMIGELTNVAGSSLYIIVCSILRLHKFI